jgi:hypothetical protein
METTFLVTAQAAWEISRILIICRGEAPANDQNSDVYARCLSSY